MMREGYENGKVEGVSGAESKRPGVRGSGAG